MALVHCGYNHRPETYQREPEHFSHSELDVAVAEAVDPND